VAFGPCGFHLRHYYAVEPDGHIYKCPGFLGHPDWAVGHVVSGLTARSQGLVDSNPQRQCGGCAHVPHCAGGCVAAEWLKAGRAEGVSCELGYFESQGEELIKRKYALATADSLAEAMAMFPPQKVPSPVPPVAARRGEAVALRVLAM
jgi:uncharacterized protein